MYRKLFCISVFVTATLTLTQLATADYTITNGSATEPAWVIYSAWRGADANWPAGYRTKGYYKIEPGDTRNLLVPENNTWIYIYVKRAGKEVKPPAHATRDAFPFWIHPSRAFIVVETAEGDFLKSNHGRWSLERADLYKYRNGGSHSIADEPRLPDLRAQQIYDQAMPSVVWIQVGQFTGSGVLIDQRRKLVVTNQHVTDNTVWVDVFFPWRNQNGRVDKDPDFYEENKELLERQRYLTKGKVIAQNVRNDIAIIQLVQIPTAAREIKHDFSKNVEDSMRQGDKVHILGNPGNRLWNWTQGTFVAPWRECLPSGGECLEMEGDTHGGNSGGPVLNGQGMLIGILAAGTDETVSLAVPAKNVKALLNTVPTYLGTISPPQQTYPKRTFKIRNRTGVTVPYQIKWSNTDNWKSSSLRTDFIKTHWSNGQNIPSKYPKIRFDYIAGDQEVAYRTYNLETVQFRENNDHAPIYYFQYNRQGNRLDLFRDVGAAPVLSSLAPEETALLSNYPNPFNPETWMPYKLSEPAEITVTIYAADGKLVRRLQLGHQATGIYQSKSRAAYWDGKNELGETVASGLYFYTLKAGEFTATRKMLIRK